MIKKLGMIVLCAASCVAARAAQAETFVIQGEKDGHEAVVKIPVSAVTKLSANFAESLTGLTGFTDSPVESMRLTGDVLINIAGSDQPIEIKADSVVLELTADFAPEHVKSGRAAAATNKLLRSGSLFSNGESGQVFVGNVVFDLQTNSGPMEIKADRVEHQLTTAEAAKNGA
jgi:hypothetical protein